MKKADIGLVGLAVMGENLILNMAGKGYTVACFNRTVSKVDDFIAGRAKGKSIIGAHTLEEFVKLIKSPRKIMIMVKAGQAVDDFIEKIIPLLDAGDILIDGGNSHYADTARRASFVESKGFRYIGAGVSGGEEGALHGPSIMPGGTSAAWPEVKPIFQAIAAKTSDGAPCCEWMGETGAGHFVKMVHNGIEYGDMQLIAETYVLLRDVVGMSCERMSSVFKEWNTGELNSYLIEITADILAYKDEDGTPLVDKILDSAGQKGTGKWAGITALDLGVPLTLIGESVFARCLSALKEERVLASAQITGPRSAFSGDETGFLEDARKALYAAKIVSYAQGYTLLRAAALEYRWKLNYGSIALVWSNGCIIRSVFLNKIKEAYDRNPDLTHLLLDPFFKSKVQASQEAWRRTVSTAVTMGIPVPAISSALAYFDGFRSARLSANLIQAQRDYFGAHTYERVDRPRGQYFHTNWTGRGGETSASMYTV
jgi:6-phosphogluconate dehydrogenase